MGTLTETPWLSVVDERPNEDKEPLLRGGALRLGDSALTLPPAKAMQAELQRIVEGRPDRALLESKLRGKTVSLKTFEIILADRHVLPTPPSRQVLPGPAAIEYLMASLAQQLRASSHATVFITVELDQREIAGYSDARSFTSPGTGSTFEPFRAAVQMIVTEMAKDDTRIGSRSP